MNARALRAAGVSPWHVVCRAHQRPVHQAFLYRSWAFFWVQGHAASHRVGDLHLWSLHHADRCPGSHR